MKDSARNHFFRGTIILFRPAVKLIKDSEKWLSTRNQPAFLKDKGKEIAKVESLPRRSSRMLVRLLAEKREQRSVQKAFQRCLAFARFSARPGQEGSSKECNFPRMYFVLSFIVSTMNFLVKADYEERGKIDLGEMTRSVNFEDRSNFSNLYFIFPFFPRKFATRIFAVIVRLLLGTR